MALLRFFFPFSFEAKNALMFLFLFLFILTGFLWTCGLVLLLILQSSQTLLLKYFFCFNFLSSYSVSVMYVAPVDVPQFLDVLFFFLFHLCIHFILRDFFLIVFKFTDSFLACVYLLMNPWKKFLISISVFDF